MIGLHSQILLITDLIFTVKKDSTMENRQITEQECAERYEQIPVVLDQGSYDQIGTLVIQVAATTVLPIDVKKHFYQLLWERMRQAYERRSESKVMEMTACGYGAFIQTYRELDPQTVNLVDQERRLFRAY